MQRQVLPQPGHPACCVAIFVLLVGTARAPGGFLALCKEGADSSCRGDQAGVGGELQLLDSCAVAKKLGTRGLCRLVSSKEALRCLLSVALTPQGTHNLCPLFPFSAQIGYSGFSFPGLWWLRKHLLQVVFLFGA